MAWLIALDAITAGCVNIMRAVANATLNKTLQRPIFSALVVSVTNEIVDLMVVIFVGFGVPDANRVSQPPLWAGL